MGWRCRAGLLASVLAACDGDGTREDAGQVDAGGDAGPDIVEPLPPDSPEPAARPLLTPCPTGWRAVPDPQWPDVVTCDPWPEGGRQDCEGASAHFPGEPGCAPIGTDCPADRMPIDLPAGARIHFVDAEAPAGGDGTREAPFQRVGSGVRNARTGDVVALAAGRYEEPVTITSSITLWGACTEGTVIARRDAAGPAVQVYGDVVLRNLTVEGGTAGVGLVEGDQRSTIEHVLVQGAVYDGVDTNEGDVDLHDVVIRDIGGPWDSRGIDAHGGSDVGLDRVVVERPGTFGIIVMEESTLRATSLSVGSTSVDSVSAEMAPGDGVIVQEGSTLELAGSVIHDTVRNGLLSQGATDVTVRDSVVQDVEPLAEAPYLERWGTGLYADRGGALHLERVLVERTSFCGVGVLGPGSVLEATDLVVRDVTAPLMPLYVPGFGASAFDEAVATLDRSAVLRPEGSGIIAGRNASLVATDLVVAGTRSATSEGGSAYGSGAEVNAGARMELRRAELLDNEQGGARSAVGGALEAEDLLVASSAAMESRTAAPGLSVESATAALQSVRIERARGWGLLALLQGVVTGADVEIVETAPSGPEREGGLGIGVRTSSRVELDRVRITDARSAGIAVVDPSTVDIQDLSIARTAGGGIGVQIGAGATVSARGFRIEQNELAGVQLLPGALLTLHRGSVIGNPVGANIQDPDFDTGPLQDDVLWDNERNFDSSALPVPGFGGTIPEAPRSCHGGDDEPLDLQQEPIGTPTWEVRGVFQTTVRPPRGERPFMNDLLSPRHIIGEEATFTGISHEGPYDDELANALHGAGCASGATFDAEELAAPGFWGIYFTLVPTDGASVGASADFGEGPILGNDVYPIFISGDLRDDDGIYDPDFEFRLNGIEELGESSLDGFSHQLIWFITNDSYGPEGSDLPGHYEFELEILDDLGNGWTIVSVFDVV